MFNSFLLFLFENACVYIIACIAWGGEVEVFIFMVLGVSLDEFCCSASLSKEQGIFFV